MACNGSGDDGNRTPTGGIGGAETQGSEPGASGEDDGDADGDGDDGDGDDGDDGDGSGGDDGDQVRFDVGDGEFCQGKEAGTYCDDNDAVTCDGNGTETETTACLPGVCLDGVGCVDCMAGQWTCKGARVMACNTDGAVPFWEQIEVCDPAAGMYCDVTVGGCSPLTPLGGTEPTGQYYQYSVHPLAADGFSVVCDVDADGDRIWFVANSAGSLSIGAYDVTVLDSDGDGEIEPNQHPDDPENTGIVEERVFTFVQSFPISNGGAVPHQMELHATPTTIFIAGPSQVSAYDLATGTISQEAPAPPWMATQPYPYLAFLGFDELSGVWYSGNESARRVFQYDPETTTWGYAFEYPALAGSHMDGLEVVTDESTGTAYVYVSDMTSNFIGQYRHDPVEGWVQENLFSYAEENGEVVEGFGYGALRHFWVGSYTQNSFYEIGGGDLTQYLEPPG